MWKAIKPVLAQIFTSKKALYTLAGIIVWLLAKAGVILSEDAVLPILGAIGVLVLGQGMADFGKEGAKEAGKTAEKLAAKASDPS